MSGKIIDFENQLDDLITEIFTVGDIGELEDFFEDTTLISILKRTLRSS